LTADFYEAACEHVNAAGIQQYEISNFARAGFESKHNIKYWTRQPYLGFGVDAHSILPATDPNSAVRFSNPDSLEKYIAGQTKEQSVICPEAALQEAFFLGLRMNCGVSLNELAQSFGKSTV